MSSALYATTRIAIFKFVKMLIPNFVYVDAAKTKVVDSGN